MNDNSKFLGKFRGVVIDNADPDGLGRIRVKVPNLLENPGSGWAMPCVPYAGNGVGLFLVPPNGASVWVEFEAGMLESPIWTGCFWNDGESPASDPNIKVLQTAAGSITIDDSDSQGVITIQTNGGMKITLDADSIEITDGMDATIELSGPTVSINDQALEVT